MEEWYRKLDVIRAVNVGAISAAALYGRTDSGMATFKEILRAVDDLPSVQPEIILCKDCVKHNKGHGRYLDGTVIGIKDCCPLVEIRGIAQGHEFDYQYCAYAERRKE